MMTRCQDHIITENIRLVWSKTSYRWDKWRCYHIGTNEQRTRVSQYMEHSYTSFGTYLWRNAMGWDENKWFPSVAGMAVLYSNDDTTQSLQKHDTMKEWRWHADIGLLFGFSSRACDLSIFPKLSWQKLKDGAWYLDYNILAYLVLEKIAHKRIDLMQRLHWCWIFRWGGHVVNNWEQSTISTKS